MSVAALKTVIGATLVDREFCEELLDGNRLTILAEFDLADEEQEAVLAIQQFPLWEKSQIVAAISQSRRTLYAAKYTRFPNRGYKTGIAEARRTRLLSSHVA